MIGSVNEDFAVESLAGDIFQLGNRSYRIQRVERGTVRVEDAHGQPPTIPFWLGEAPGRTDELSVSVSRLRGETAARLRSDPTQVRARRWLVEEVGIGPPATEQLLEYLAAGAAVFGCLPTQETVVLERFFDEAGGSSSSFMPRSAVASTALGGWRYASASAGSLISSSRRPQPRTTSCCR